MDTMMLLTNFAPRRRRRASVPITPISPLNLGLMPGFNLQPTDAAPLRMFVPRVQTPQPAQPAQQQAVDLLGDFLVLAWNVVIKVREPQWKKDSPRSLAIYKWSDELASLPSITAEGKKWLNVVKGVTFLYGLDQSDH